MSVQRHLFTQLVRIDLLNMNFGLVARSIFVLGARYRSPYSRCWGSIRSFVFSRSLRFWILIETLAFCRNFLKLCLELKPNLLMSFSVWDLFTSFGNSFKRMEFILRSLLIAQNLIGSTGFMRRQAVLLVLYGSLMIDFTVVLSDWFSHFLYEGGMFGYIGANEYRTYE